MLLIFCAVEGFRVEFLVCYQKDQKVQVFPRATEQLRFHSCIAVRTGGPSVKKKFIWRRGYRGVYTHTSIHIYIYICNT